MMPTSFHGSSVISTVVIVLFAVLGITFTTFRIRSDAELSFFKRKSAIVKTENEKVNQNEIKGIDSEKIRGY